MSNQLDHRGLVVALLVLLLIAIVAAEWSGLRRQAWRTFYPNLPPIVQVLPYRAAAELRRIGAGPIDPAAPLPTARAATDATAQAVTGSLAPGSSTGTTARPTAIGPAAVTAPPAAYSWTPTADSSSFSSPIETTPQALPTIPPPHQAAVTGLRHEYQTWNNCGPATIGMALSALQWQGDQRVAAARLKPDPDDKNVSPDELARFARESGFQATVRYGGTVDRLRDLIAAGLPVIIETWFIPEPGDEMGHYVLLEGYDATQMTFQALDSYNGPNVTLDWETFDELWRVFGRVYVVVSSDEEVGQVGLLLGPDVDDRSMWVRAAATARQESLEIDDAFAHFNLGTALLALGDSEASAAAFDTARSRGLPWRMLWYQFAPYEAYSGVGRWEDVLALTDATLARMPNLEESLYWRGRALEATGDIEGATRDWRKALEINPLFTAPADALSGG